MTLSVISAGFGRTGTMSLKLALDELGFGPCHHMDEVIEHSEVQVPLWRNALDGVPDFAAIYAGYRSAVDWPTAAFWRELAGAYPKAKLILTSRPVESWVRSFSDTILATLLDIDNWPLETTEWLHTVKHIVIERSLQGAVSPQVLAQAFLAHEAAVKAEIPASRLLVHRAEDGWEPLCAFLGAPIPETPYPYTNSDEDFFDLLEEAKDVSSGSEAQ